jgi:hypothetical protein
METIWTNYFNWLFRYSQRTKKNTLLKNAQANAASIFFKRVFFSPPKKEFQNFFPNAQKKIKTPQRMVRTSNSCASNVNRFEQPVSELQTVVLRPNSKPAGNIRLKEITLVHPHTVA